MHPLALAARSAALALLLGLTALACGGQEDGVVLADMEAQTHALINAERQAQGLPALAWEALIADAARGHSRDMSSGQVEFGHDGFDARVDALAEQLPWSSAGENVAWNQGYPDPAAQAVEGWMDSPGHRENILGDYDRTGIGIAGDATDGYYFTQIFLRD
ncbi:MAG TPA: CAP domain-containing protein [Myxococcota bacterium]|nr:CAP domain-containing protein [Myxococcota bacterium]HRY97151.1 CAP domain-containing protein [Myxococcota bacterium]HSA21393.1 CAP domain-containing protein [Myxococcota bacterium]